MPLTAKEEHELLELLQAEAYEQEGRKIDVYFPDDGPLRRELYPKHLELFKAGATHTLRLFLAANRVGKTEGEGCELVYHLTGEYPDWWEGRRFSGPITAWAAGDTNPKTQEILQAKLFGTDDARQTPRLGTGVIPRDSIASLVMRPGVPGAIQSVRIRHQGGGMSTLTLKSFEQGVEAFQGNEVHVIWLDELAPLAILSECIIRTTPTPWFEGGMVVWTVTPIEGLTDAILQFLPDGQIPEGPQLPPQYVVNATWDDAPHLTEETKEGLKAAFAGHLAYQLDARSRGIPVLGAGVIYPVPEESYTIEPFELPAHYRRAYALDVGWNRTAALWGAYDPDSDIWYAYSEHYQAHEKPSSHAEAMKGRGAWIPGVVDPSARNRTIADGRRIMHQYQQLGLKLTPANNAVEAGLYAVLERLASGRLQVFSTLQHFFKEIRLYRRDDKGKIIKVNDHLMDCLRYLMMSGLQVADTPVQQREEARQPRAWTRQGRAHSWMG